MRSNWCLVQYLQFANVLINVKVSSMASVLLSLSLSVCFNGHIPVEPGLAGV